MYLVRMIHLLGDLWGQTLGDEITAETSEQSVTIRLLRNGRERVYEIHERDLTPKTLRAITQDAARELRGL
jgi:hypothetical protein